VLQADRSDAESVDHRAQIRVIGGGSILVMSGPVDDEAVARFVEEISPADCTARGAARRMPRVDWIDLGQAQHLPVPGVEVLSALVTQRIPSRIVLAHVTGAVAAVLDEHGVSALVNMVD
jgi:hypothetical protein